MRIRSRIPSAFGVPSVGNKQASTHTPTGAAHAHSHHHPSTTHRHLNQLAEAVREAATALPSEARNVFLRTPEGLETPAFRVLHEAEDVSAVRGRLLCGCYVRACVFNGR